MDNLNTIITAVAKVIDGRFEALKPSLDDIQYLIKVISEDRALMKKSC